MNNLRYAARKNHTIHQPEQFLKPKFEPLEEIEVSPFEDFRVFSNELFIGFDCDGKVVTQLKDKKRILSWKYARKIDTKRIEAIEKAKEIIKEYNLTPDELCLT